MTHRSVILGLLVAGCGASAPAPPVAKSAPPPVYFAPLTDDAAYLDAAVAGRSIVFLGESLHGTDTFPRLRLPLLRRLHEKLGFDVIAFEGSPVDAWLAQDDMDRGMNDADAGREGWIAPWNTPAMREVLHYVRASHMYFASMDIQPAMGMSPVKNGLLARFISRMIEYGGGSANPDQLAGELTALRTCNGQPPVAAMGELADLIHAAEPRVRARSEMHADALARIPQVLVERMRHCADTADAAANERDYWRRYKENRDRYQAMNVLALARDVSRSHEIVVWAHHSHSAYGAAGASGKVSIAGELRARAPDAVYSIGVFGGRGHFRAIHDGPSSGDELVGVDESCSGLAALGSLSTGRGYFIDLGHVDVPFAHTPHCYPLEGEGMDAVLADEFDAVVYTPRIDATNFD